MASACSVHIDISGSNSNSYYDNNSNYRSTFMIINITNWVVMLLLLLMIPI